MKEGNIYEVTKTNGKKTKNLSYSRIAYGNNSKHGKINIYFIKTSKYRGVTTSKEVMIKYDSILSIKNMTSVNNPENVIDECTRDDDETFDGEASIDDDFR